MVERSPEIEAVVRRFLRAFELGDPATVGAVVDRSAHTMILGSDPMERVVGDSAVEYLVASTKYKRDYTYDIAQLDAFEHGSVGWAAVDAVAVFPFDESKPHLRYDPVPVRISAVLLLDKGMWRIVQWHFSTPVPDDPAVSGAELTEAMSEMVRAFDEAAQVSDLTSRLKTNTVSLVFTDIVDSTVRTGEAGDEAWTTLVTRHFDEIDRIATDNDGVVVKTTGDGAMLAFSSARKAVHAAVELRISAAKLDPDSPLKLRIGVHVGEAVKTEVDYFGQTVNEAARIMSAAEPEQILVSDLVRSLVGEMSGIDFDEPISLELKGIPGRRRAYPIILER